MLPGYQQNVINAGMNLMRRLPTRQTEKSVAAISSLILDEAQRDDFTVKTDQPLGKCPNQLANV